MKKKRRLSNADSDNEFKQSFLKNVIKLYYYILLYNIIL